MYKHARAVRGVSFVEKPRPAANGVQKNVHKKSEVKKTKKRSVTNDERRQIGFGDPSEERFLAEIQAQISLLVRKGIRNPKLHADHLNKMGLLPFSGVWTSRLVVIFFKRQSELRQMNSRAKPCSELERRSSDLKSEKKAGSGNWQSQPDTNRTKLASNPVLNSDIGSELLARFAKN